MILFIVPWHERRRRRDESTVKPPHKKRPLYTLSTPLGAQQQVTAVAGGEPLCQREAPHSPQSRCTMILFGTLFVWVYDSVLTFSFANPVWSSDRCKQLRDVKVFGVRATTSKTIHQLLPFFQGRPRQILTAPTARVSTNPWRPSMSGSRVKVEPTSFHILDVQCLSTVPLSRKIYTPPPPVLGVIVWSIGKHRRAELSGKGGSSTHIHVD